MKNQKLLPVTVFVVCFAVFIYMASIFLEKQRAKSVPVFPEVEHTVGIHNIPADPGPGFVETHLMVNGQIFWQNSTMTDDLWERDGFTCIGVIKKDVAGNGEVTEDFQSYHLAEGTKIYGHKDFPEVLYVIQPTGADVFCQGDTIRRLLNWDGVIYGDLSGIESYQGDAYREKINAIYGHLSYRVDAIPESADYLGETRFVGVGRWPRKENDSNYFQQPVSVWRDYDNPEILYAGKDEIYCYVPLLDQPIFDT